MELATVATVVAIIAGTATVTRLSMGGAWSLSGRISNIEATLSSLQKELSRLADVLVVLADVRGELKVLNNRVNAAEQDIRDLQHSEGLVLPLPSSRKVG